MSRAENHPSGASLALYAGDDCGLFLRAQVWHHVSGCLECQAEIAAHQATKTQLVNLTSTLPESLHWDRLAEEMTANIRLGLEAGECVAPFRARREARSFSFVDWRAVAVMAAMVAIIVGAWFLNPPARNAEVAMRSPKIQMRTTSLGLELNENGNSMVLMHGNGNAAMQPAMIVSSPGSLRARYVDSDTGQITINNVYSE